MQQMTLKDINADVYICKAVRKLLIEHMKYEDFGEKGDPYNCLDQLAEIRFAVGALNRYEAESSYEENVVSDAKQALHWVADNLDSLWS